MVERDVNVPVTYLDWTLPARAPSGGHELARLLDRDRAAGIWTSSTAPLMRLALARLSATEVQVVWTFHHVLLDGWSVFQVLSDVFAAHARARPTATAGAGAGRRPFRDYLRWLAEQDRAAAERHWRQRLADLSEPTATALRPPARWRRTAPSPRETVRVDAARRARPAGCARWPSAAGLTVNTVVQGAWALLLSRYSGAGRRGVRHDGVRPPGRAARRGVDGRHVHQHLPTRVTVRCRAAAWRTGCATLQAAQAEARRFDFVSLARLQA